MTSASVSRGTRLGLLARRAAAGRPWIWSYLAALVLWAVIVGITGRGLAGTMTSAISLAPFLVLVGLGQMFVITAGSGNIDLSVQYTMPLAGFVALEAAAHLHSVPLGVLAGLSIGVLVAAANLIGILVLSIPPIVATLAVGLLAYSASSLRSVSFSGAIPASLHTVTVHGTGGISVLAFACVALTLVAAFALHRTGYGRYLQAVGQNTRAASLAGAPVRGVLITSYVSCGLLAALAGILLSAYASPSVGLGTPYLLNSIAVVVLGGSLISGGRSSVAGIWGGALFLLLLVTLLNTSNISIATQRHRPGGPDRDGPRADGGEMNGPGGVAVAGLINHVGIAVTDADEAAARFAALLGLDVVGDEVISEVGVRLVYLAGSGGSGHTTIQLVQPVQPGPVRDHLDRHGEGPHHVCFTVRSIEDALASLPGEAGSVVFTGGRGSRACFLTARPAGTTIELIETSGVQARSAAGEP